MANLQESLKDSENKKRVWENNVDFLIEELKPKVSSLRYYFKNWAK